MDPRLRLRHLQCFLETARLGSLSGAADSLRVSQPAASKTLRELEEIVGVSLFDRTTRRLRLSPAGRLFQQHVGAAMMSLQKAQDAAQQAPARITRLTIGALPTVATDFLPRAALRFHDAAPHCSLRVTTGPNWLLLSQLRDGSLDLVVGRMPGPDNMTGLTFRQLYTERVVLVVRPGHALLKARDLAAELGDYPLMLPPPGALIAPAVRSFLISIGLPHRMAEFETVSLAFGRKVVQASDIVWFISEGVVGDELAAGTLAALDPGTDLLAGPVGICTRAHSEKTPEAAQLMQSLLDMPPVGHAVQG